MTEKVYVTLEGTATVPGWAQEITGVGSNDNTIFYYGNNYGFNGGQWLFSDIVFGDDGKTVTYCLIYRDKSDEFDNIVDKSESATKLEPIFDSIKVPSWMNGDDLALLEGMTITVEAHAIQADGFSASGIAWQAFEASPDYPVVPMS